MTKSDFYTNKLVLVTGASSGIGRALSIRISREGAAVALIGRDRDRLHAAGEGAVGRAKGFEFDLADIASIKVLVERIERDFAQAVDVVIHAAGVATVGKVEDTPIEAMQEIIVVNLIAAMSLSQAVLPGMRARRAGKLVFMSSGVANFGVPGEATYSASKAGLERLSESLRSELAGSGVSVCVVSPGPVETPLMRSPRCYGNSTLVGRPSIALDPNVAAEKIAERLPSGTSRIELSFRGSLVRHLSYWAPGALGWLLRRQASGVAQS